VLGTRLSWIGRAALGVVLFAAPALCRAQEPTADSGRVEYLNSCAVCHGVDGKGNELAAALLRISIPDLTALQKNNGGTLPLSRLYNAIDGRDAVATRGPRAMPVWGRALGMRLGKLSGGAATVQERESYAWRRILALIGYISNIQSK